MSERVQKLYAIRIPTLAIPNGFVRCGDGDVCDLICLFTTRRAAEAEIVDSLEMLIHDWKEGNRSVEEITIEEYVEPWWTLDDGGIENEFTEYHPGGSYSIEEG